jgi:hypothetical protein
MPSSMCLQSIDVYADVMESARTRLKTVIFFDTIVRERERQSESQCPRPGRLLVYSPVEQLATPLGKVPERPSMSVRGGVE